VNASLLQPFVSHTFPNRVTLSVSSESSYDWERRQWMVPLNAGIGRLFDFGGQKVSLGLVGRSYVDRPEGGPDWGVRLQAALVFPR
jgi:hypothetical protein